MQRLAEITGAARVLSFLIRFAFLISGVVTVLIGQILPILSARLSLNDEDSGYFFIAQFAGSLLGTFVTQPLINRFGFISVIAVGCGAMTLGVSGLNAGSWNLCLFAFFVNGFGIGTTLPAINMLTVELNPENVTGSLNFLNFFWGIGAIFCKPFVDFFSTDLSILRPTLILSVGLAVTGFAIFILPRRLEPKKNFARQSNDDKLPPIWSTPLAWLIALFNFIHVGFESGAGGWINTYSTRFSEQNDFTGWLSPITLYFLLFVVGRGIAPLYAKFFSENLLILISLLILTTAMLISLFGNDYALLSFGSALAGFGTATIFPTNMARFTKTFGESATRRSAPIFICGTLGSTVTTFLIGYISNHYNDLRLGMFVLLGSCFALLAIQIILMCRKSL